MGIFDWMSEAPAAGGYMDQTMDYVMRYGSPSQFGISPDQRAQHFKQQELAQNLKFINENQIPGQGAYGPEPDGAISANQFNPAKNMELAMRTGQMGQFIAGQQALERQQQGQHWESKNWTLAQKTAADAASARLQWDKERQGMEFAANRSHQMAQEQISRGQLGVSQANQGLQQQRFNAEFMPDPNNPKGFVPRPVQQVPKVPVGYQVTSEGAMVPIPGTDDWRKGQADVTSLQEGAAGAKQLAEHLKKFGTAEMWNRDAATVANVHRNAAITGLGVLSNMGVLQPGDLDRLSAQLADPTDYGPSALISRRDPAIAAAKEVAKRLDDAASATSSRFKGQSAPPNSAKVLTYNPKTGRLE